MISGSNSLLPQITSTFMSINNSQIPFLPSVKYLGVTLDSSLTLQSHISNICRSSFLALKRISTIRPFLSDHSTAILINASVTSRLDYCNSILYGISVNQLSRLQRIQNHAARIVLKKRKRDHITPLLMKLHWLPLSFRIQYKLAVLSYGHFENKLPPYLSTSLSIYQPSRTLRSSSKKLLIVPPPNLVFR